jgi:dihydrofolate synthase/folylpolyglutamate synthase
MTDPGAGSSSHPPSELRLSYTEALDFWFGRVNYELRTPTITDLKLDRMRHLLATLGNPQERLRIVHVAGSKGKGSTSAMLAAIMREAGYCTGLFTSPHLCRVEERIQVDGQSILPAELAAIMSDIAAAIERMGNDDPPTFFEIATALGFLHFVRRRAQIAIIEVGLGGRFDSTNVCLPECSLITSISFDHTQQLGNRLESIAMEKAGIIKPRTPAISGATSPEVRSVIERICEERGAPLRELGIDFSFGYEPGRVEALADKGDRLPRVTIRTQTRTWPMMKLGLLGAHQAANAAVTVTCIEQLRRNGWHCSDAAVARGLRNVTWPARQEIVSRRPLIMLDCAHNVASMEALVDTLDASFPPGRRYLVFASSNDKDVSGILRCLAPHFTRAYLTRYGQNQRSVPPERLRELLEEVSELPSETFESAQQALESARKAAGPDELICITGSVFLAGELKPLL